MASRRPAQTDQATGPTSRPPRHARSCERWRKGRTSSMLHNALTIEWHPDHRRHVISGPARHTGCRALFWGAPWRWTPWIACSRSSGGLTRRVSRLWRGAKLDSWRWVPRSARGGQGRRLAVQPRTAGGIPSPGPPAGRRWPVAPGHECPGRACAQGEASLPARHSVGGMGGEQGPRAFADHRRPEQLGGPVHEEDDSRPMSSARPSKG